MRKRQSKLRAFRGPENSGEKSKKKKEGDGVRGKKWLTFRIHAPPHLEEPEEKVESLKTRIPGN